MGIFGKKDNYDDYDDFNDFTRNANPDDSAPRPGRINVDDDEEEARYDAEPSRTQVQPDPEPELPKVLTLGDAGITQIAAINRIAKTNGWKFSVEFPGGLIDMYFEGRNFKIVCRGVDYRDEDNIPTGTSLATMIKKRTASYDQKDYIYKKEQALINSSQRMITEDDIKTLRNEASEIRTNLDGLIAGLENMEPKAHSKNISAEDFGKKHNNPSTAATPSKPNETTKKPVDQAQPVQNNTVNK